MSKEIIYTIDLHFMDIPGTITSYLIPHKRGGVLVECGPGSTQAALQAGLELHGLSPGDITDVLLTHIHLDHAGAAGWLAQQGARIHVHPKGAPHMLNPEKLLDSAGRIYGDTMESLWGEFLPVEDERLSVVENGDIIDVDGLQFRAIDTPGHANHHYVYIFEDICFSGDIGGVRLAGLHHLRLPMPPPEFHLEKWHTSLKKLTQENFDQIAPTHFGIYSDSGWHLNAVEKALDEVEIWIEATLPNDPPIETLNEQFLEWSRMRSLKSGLDPEQIKAYQAVNPNSMSSVGIHRYWHKYRAGNSSGHHE